MAQRLVRAKQKIRARRHSLRGAGARSAASRGCDGVLAVIYLVFTEGYAATSGED